jgi:hypothetical protein
MDQSGQTIPTTLIVTIELPGCCCLDLFPLPLLLGLRAASCWGLDCPADDECFPWTGKRKAHSRQVSILSPRILHKRYLHPIQLRGKSACPEAANGMALASADGWQQPLTQSPIQNNQWSTRTVRGEVCVTSLTRYFPGRELSDPFYPSYRECSAQLSVAVCRGVDDPLFVGLLL